MSNQPLICVIDANVALKVVLDQPLSNRADALFAYYESDPEARFHVPGFFYAECVHILTKYVRLHHYPADDAKENLQELKDLAFQVASTTALADDALSIAIAHRINGYDACYVALAHQLKAPLITTDEKLARAMANTSYDVQSLATFEIPPIV